MIFPEGIKLSTEEHSLQAQFYITEDLPYLKGHFDKKPVLPGVVQVGWALSLAEKAFARSFVFRGLKGMKCTQLVLPPIDIEFKVRFFPDKHYLKFESRTPVGKCASGVILLEPNTETGAEI